MQSARAEDMKIAVVDMAQVMNTYPETQAADSQLEDQVAEFEEEQKDLLEEFNVLKKEFDEARQEAANRALSDAAREEKRQHAESKLMSLRDHERKIQETMEFRRKQINDQRIRMRERIVSKLHGIVAEYAEKKGYSLVLDSAETSKLSRKPVVYCVDSLDITEDILDITAPDRDESKDVE